MFVLKNDLNDETFKCTPKGSNDLKIQYLQQRNSIIGKYVKVQYRERSGVDNLPFHANVIEIVK
jgi:hypothetical protein